MREDGKTSLKLFRNDSLCCEKFPEKVIDLLIRRIEIANTIQTGNFWNEYCPFPYLGFDDCLNGVIKSQIYPQILRNVRNHVIFYEDVGKFWISSLFLEISDNYCKTSIEVMNEWIYSRDEELVKSVGILVKGADPKFLFDHSEFVSKIIETAYNISDECHSAILDSLYKISINGVKQFIGKEPLVEDINQKNLGEEYAKKFQIGSPTHRFYTSISKSAQRSINTHMKWMEEIYD
jgi:hypothetical protein